jgi:peptide/nickel transport system permease protein
MSEDLPVEKKDALKEEPYIREHTWKDKSFFIVLNQFSQNKTALFGLCIVGVMVFMAFFAPLITQYKYNAVDPLNANKFFSLSHWLGTDSLGRDIYTRIVYGARYSLSIGVGSEILGLVIGIFLGALAGYYGGIIDNLVMRLCDVLQNIPNLLLCICVSQALGGGLFPTMLALSVPGIPFSIRLLRAVMLSVRGMEFVEAAQLITCSKPRIIFKHIVPNCLTPILIGFSMGVGGKIMASAGLSYLGLGIQEPLPEWGAMISSGKMYMTYYPHLVIIPGIFVALVVLSFNMISDGLRDALDPKLRT